MASEMTNEEKRKRLLLFAAMKAKQQDVEAQTEEPDSFAGGAGAFGLGAVKQVPVLGSNLEDIAANLAANPQLGDPLRGEGGQLDPEAVAALAKKFRGMTAGVKAKYPKAYGSGAVSSVAAQMLIPGGPLAKAPALARLLAAPAISAGTGYMERPEGAESMTPEQERAARATQAKWGAAFGFGGQALSELPTALNFGKAAARKAYAATRPDRKTRLLDIGFEDREVPEEIGRTMIESGLLKGIIPPSRSTMLKRAQKVSNETGQDIGRQVAELDETGVAASPLKLMSAFSLKARPMRGTAGYDKQMSKLQKNEQEFLTSTAPLLKISPQQLDKVADQATKDVKRIVKTLKTPISDEEVRALYSKWYQRRLIGTGELIPSSVQKIKSAVQGGLKKEYETPPALRTPAQKSRIKMEGSKAGVLKDSLLDMAERGGGRSGELSKAMNKYGNLETAEYNLEKALSEPSPWKRYGPLGAAGIGASLVGVGEMIDSPEARLAGLLGGLGTAYGMSRGAQTSARLLDALSKMKTKPLATGLLGGMYGATMAPGYAEEQ